MTVVALKSKALVGSPTYRIVSGLVLLSEVQRVPMSLAISTLNLVIRPPSAKPVAKSAYTPQATPKYNIDFLIIDLPTLPNDDPKFPLTTGVPKVLD